MPSQSSYERHGMISPNKTAHLSRLYILAASFFPFTYTQSQLSKHRCLNDFLPLPNFAPLPPSPSTPCQMLFVFQPYAFRVPGPSEPPSSRSTRCWVILVRGRINVTVPPKTCHKNHHPQL